MRENSNKWPYILEYYWKKNNRFLIVIWLEIWDGYLHEIETR